MTSDPRPDWFGNTRWFLENFLFGTSLAACTAKRRLINWQRPTRARTNPGTARARRLIIRRPEHARADPSTTTRGEWRQERRGGLTREWREAGRVEWPGGEYLIILGPKWTEPVRSDPVRSGIYSFSSNLSTNDICVMCWYYLVLLPPVPTDGAAGIISGLSVCCACTVPGRKHSPTSLQLTSNL